MSIDNVNSWKSVPEYSLDKFIFCFWRCFGWCEVRLKISQIAGLQTPESTLTALRMSAIQALLSRGNRVTNVDSNSTKFGVAERGATPAKSLSKACMILRPWASMKASFASLSSSFVAVLLMRDDFHDR